MTPEEAISRCTMTLEQYQAMLDIAVDAMAECSHIHLKWGQQNHPDADPVLLSRAAISHQRLAEEAEIPTAARAKFLVHRAVRQGGANWTGILVEEVAEAVDAIGDSAELRAELVQVAAVAMSWIAAIDRRGGA